MKQQRALIRGVALAAVFAAAANAEDTIADVVRQLNDSPSVASTTESASYPEIFAAYLDLTPPPFPIGPGFNLTTIHPEMKDWAKVSGWAESNPDMAKALLAVETKTLFGLPYDVNDVESRFREAGLVAEIGVGGSLRDNRFTYLTAIETVVAFATAESYRLLEAGRYEEGIDLAVATIFLLRQCCDREFLAEVSHAITLSINALANLLDMFTLYREKISPDQYAEIAIQKLPFLRPDRSRLLIPEGDRVVAAALIAGVFDDRGQADREKFAGTFAEIQSKDAPLTRFGAARRWRMIAEVHDSEEVSLERLGLVYDDWWRRWRVEEYDPILDVPTQFERTNPVRYAAVIYSLQDLQQLFGLRRLLVTAVNGTAVAAGLCGYYERNGTYPTSVDKMYAQFCRKRSDRDPYDTSFAPFKYRLLASDFPVDTPEGRLFLEPGECILYSKGADNDDDRGGVHRYDGAAGDVVIWPAMRALEREAGLMD